MGPDVDGSAKAAVRVGLYAHDNETPDASNRLSSLNYDVHVLTSASLLTANSLSSFDVLYVANKYAGELSDQAAVIANWVAQGNGLIVEQPNVEGPVGIMPPGLSVSVLSRSYDGSGSMPDPVRRVALTSAGLVHPVTVGLTTQDLCDNADKVLISDISPAFDILGVQATNPTLVAIATSDYGAGRVVFHTGNINPLAFRPGSDLYVRQMIDWAAIPEPESFALVVSGVVTLSCCRRMRR